MIFQSQQLFYPFSKNIFPTVAVAFFGLIGLGACTGTSNESHGRLRTSPLTTEAAKNYRPLQVNAIAVLPLDSADASVPAPEQVQEILLGALERRTSLELLNRTEATHVATELARVRNLPKPLRDQAAELGRAVGAQGVLYGVVTRFDQTTGSRMGADRPSHAGFRLWLIDPKTAQVLWTASYDNEEQALSDNLFRLGEKLKSGVGFRTAEELMKVGFEAAGDELETLRRVRPETKPAG